jgi:hypothetical protein
VVAIAQISLEFPVQSMDKNVIICMLHLLPSGEVHVFSQQREDVRIESLPVGVVEMVLLRALLLVPLHDTELGLVLHTG